MRSPYDHPAICCVSFVGFSLGRVLAPVDAVTLLHVSVHYTHTHSLSQQLSTYFPTTCEAEHVPVWLHQQPAGRKGVVCLTTHG